ncbi:MAG: nodulation protein NfeD [Bacteroidia bacterium]|nr:nodulation protein NfeD [Bacteroidia bacterium]NNJ56679.1 nodulation protein NfeD [Bacteroidia bacterium]
MKQLFVKILLLVSLFASAQVPENDTKKTVVVFDLKEDIAPAAARITSKAVRHAEDINADLILVHMNTYGGYVIDADSIRTSLLNTKIPVYVFIDNNAASAGALISLACDKIYMRPGGNIGATTVVNETGEKAPDKYQSYMRKQMRSTAESHGMDTIINGRDTTYKYKRNPDIAEGMVDERVVVEGLDDAEKVITLTTEEALIWGYCEGKVESLDEILKLNNVTNYKIEKVEKSNLDHVIAFFANPALRSVLIMLMIGGIYFELQSPGIGFPLAVAIIAAVSYFAPLYLEGMAENWEILLFFIGFALVAAEVFIIPGFGVAGISGILLIVVSLVLSMIGNVNFDFSGTDTSEWNNALASLFFAFIGLFALIFFFGSSFINSKFFRKVVLMDTLDDSHINVQQERTETVELRGAKGVATTAFRPMGRINIDGVNYEAKTYGEFIDLGDKVEVLSIENQYLVVKKISV